jgi:uncharacterized membrane protein
MAPPTDAITVTVAVALFAAAQEPLVSTALYEVVEVKLVAVNVVVVLAMFVPAVAKLFKEDSQRVILPVCPLKVNTVEFVPVHTDALPAMDPPTDAITVTVAVALFAAAQEPLVRTALYEVVEVKLVAVNVVVVFDMLVPAVAKLFKEDSQRVILPVCPLKVNTVEFVPVHTDALPAMDPPTDAITVTVAVALFAAAQEPLLRTALYEVVEVKLVAVNVVVVLAMLVPAVAKLFKEDSQRVIILPVCPLKVNTVEFVPVHTDALPAMDPPADAITVTVAVALFAAAQEPLLRTALYEVVEVKLVAVNVVVVFAMLVPAVAKLFKEDSQRVILPVCPLKVNTVEFVPVHTVALPAMAPPTDAGLTVTVIVTPPVVFVQPDAVPILLTQYV